jgi:hypothetical protein
VAKVAPTAGSGQQQSSKSTTAPTSQAAGPENKAAPPFYQTIGVDKLLAFCFGVFFALILLLIAIFDRKPSPIGILIYRVLLALVAAGVGAVLPGMIDVNINALTRAGGAIALFVVVYRFNPASTVSGPPE